MCVTYTTGTRRVKKERLILSSRLSDVKLNLTLPKDILHFVFRGLSSKRCFTLETFFIKIISIGYVEYNKHYFSGDYYYSNKDRIHRPRVPWLKTFCYTVIHVPG